MTERLLAGGMVRLFKDGNQWCALYGKDLQEGIAGFGDTELPAIRALFRRLGYGDDVNWFAPNGEPEVYIGGGVHLLLAKAIRNYEVESVEGEVEKLKAERDSAIVQAEEEVCRRRPLLAEIQSLRERTKHLEEYCQGAIHLFKTMSSPKEECDCEPEVGNAPCVECAIRIMATGERWSRE